MLTRVLKNIFFTYEVAEKARAETCFARIGAALVAVARAVEAIPLKTWRLKVTADISYKLYE